jgi:HAD superfamily hydrolase (TIGR01509 family)
VYEAVLFDMDGVIADTERSVTEFWQWLAADLGYLLRAEDLERHVYGHRADHTLRVLFPEVPPSAYSEIYQRLKENQESLVYTAIPGATALLGALGRAGVPLALVTGAQDWKAVEVLRQLALPSAFATVICADDVPRGKPDPAGYLLAAERLGVDIGRCLVFEDAVSGVTSAVAAGATCVALACARREAQVRAAGATAVVPDFRQAAFDATAATLRVDARTAFPFVPAGRGEPMARSGHG